MRVMLLVSTIFFTSFARAEDYLCAVTKNGVAESLAPMVVGPDTTVIYLAGRRWYQKRIRYVKGKIDAMAAVSREVAKKPHWYEHSEFAAVSRPGTEKALNMYVGNINFISEISAVTKYRRFDDKGPQRDSLEASNLAINCEGE